jgi:hypothetical protein
MTQWRRRSTSRFLTSTGRLSVIIHCSWQHRIIMTIIMIIRTWSWLEEDIVYDGSRGHRRRSRRRAFLGTNFSAINVVVATASSTTKNMMKLVVDVQSVGRLGRHCPPRTGIRIALTTFSARRGVRIVPFTIFFTCPFLYTIYALISPCLSVSSRWRRTTTSTSRM